MKRNLINDNKRHYPRLVKDQDTTNKISIDDLPTSSMMGNIEGDTTVVGFIKLEEKYKWII